MDRSMDKADKGKEGGVRKEGVMHKDTGGGRFGEAKQNCAKIKRFQRF